MIAPSPDIIHDPNVLPALRDLFSQHPAMTQSVPEALARRCPCSVTHPAAPKLKVEAALEALTVGGPRRTGASMEIHLYTEGGSKNG
jgi:hypothetical protein